MNLRAIDLNLLVALDALLKERHVTRAGERIGLSQPAMSNALSRLRELLHDPILVRGREGMVLTPRAQELREPLRGVLLQLEGLLADTGDFDPASTEKHFRLMTTDAIECLLIPPLMDVLTREAPRVSLEQRPFTPTPPPWQRLEEDDLDFVLGVFSDVPHGINMRELYRNRFVCIARRGHPAIGGEAISLDEFCQVPQIFLAPGRGRLGSSWVDRALEAQNRRRIIALTISHFLVALQTVAETDLITTFPDRVAARYIGDLPIQVLELPLEVPEYAVSLAWHDRLQQDSAARWLRERIAGLSSGM